MGEKRVSRRTLDSGEQVVHYPDGTQILVQDESPLKARLEANEAENQRRHEAMKQDHVNRLAVKRQAQRDGGVPPEKSVV